MHKYTDTLHHRLPPITLQQVRAYQSLISLHKPQKTNPMLPNAVLCILYGKRVLHTPKQGIYIFTIQSKRKKHYF